MELTLATGNIGDLVTNSHVSDEISLSDHRYMEFQKGDLVTYRNHKRMNWESYWKDLKVNLGVLQRVIHLVRDVELAVDMLQQVILSSYHQNCPAREALSTRTVLWWNKELSHLKALTRELFNHAKKTGDWESYKMALTCYNTEIRIAKRSSWRDYSRGIEEVPDRARLMGIMASQSANRVEYIKLLDGRYQSEKRDTEGAIQSSFSSVCWRRSSLGRTRAAKPESICCS
jgi:hypothetical protein